MQTYNFPHFFGTTITFANQSRYLTSLMNLAISSLLISIWMIFFDLDENVGPSIE